MKNIGKIIVSFLAWALIASIAATKLQMNFGIAPVISTLCFLALSVFLVLFVSPKTFGVGAAVDQEIWLREIMKRLWKNNMFLTRAYDEGEYVLGGAVVHIPQPGAAPNVVKNRSTYPGVSVRRSDTDITYLLNDYTTDPTHIPRVELATITYDKTSSVIQDLFGYLMQYVADDQLVNWLQGLSATGIINTTGAATAALEAGQTGNRNAMIWQNLRDAQRVMNKANVSPLGRVALFEENMFQQFVDSLSATPYKDFSAVYNPETGTIGKLFGFDIMTRSTVGVVSAGAGALAVNAVGQAAAATDNVACLCFQQEALSNALGTTEMFQKIGDPTYYGDIFSTRIRMGGRRRRADDLGVVAIVQGTPAGN